MDAEKTLPPQTQVALLRGAIDGFEGLYMTGWAVAANPKDHRCVISVLDATGQIVAEGQAALPRADLASLGYGHTSFAFRIALPDRATPTTFTVTADGQPFGSPVTVGRGIFDGYIRLLNGNLAGWVTERCVSNEVPVVDLVDPAGTIAGHITPYYNSKSDDPVCRSWEFQTPIPAICARYQELLVQMRANGVNVGAPIKVAMSVDGQLENIQPTRCVGWLGSYQTPGRHFEIEVFRDNVLVGSGLADRANTMAGGVPSRNWDVGFDIPLALPKGGPGINYTMSLRLAGTDIELFDGPFIVGDRSSLIESGRRVARLAQAAAPGFDPAERAMLRDAISDYIERIRRGPHYMALSHAQWRRETSSAIRLTVLIPIYRSVEITRTCIESVLGQRDPARDAIMLVNDCSPEEGMGEMLKNYASEPNVVVLENDTNIGFVQSVNRGLKSCLYGDVLLLNSDTRLFAGAIDELAAVAHGSPEIGTVTALSNNATIFTYPAINAAEETLDDISWEELALVALVHNRGKAVDVPTAHGFCMLVKRSMLDSVGTFNEVFGRGYCEENEFCQRGSDLGFRHVAATGVLVEHRERTSFGVEREALLQGNLSRLAEMYPEYNVTIANFEKSDPLHLARWTLHKHRLEKARMAVDRVALIVSHQLGGGTARAEQELEETVGYGGAMRLRLSCSSEGTIELSTQKPDLCARFDPKELEPLFEFLDAFGIDFLLIHNVLGFEPEFIARIGQFAEGRRSIWYAHDFYPICPRATMIDAIGEYCGGPEALRCTRCIDLAGAHGASRANTLTPTQHRELFGKVLGQMTQIVAPSLDTAKHLTAVLPNLPVVSIGHPHLGPAFPTATRTGSWHNIVLLGAIGPHKGSADLFRLARRALLTHPALRFHIIGYTNIDAELAVLENVSISGSYQSRDLDRLIQAADARIALFLHPWPETFSYTLSEAVAYGLIPMVPDIGAPAERVRASGFGVIFPAPFDARTVLSTLTGIADGQVPFSRNGATPADYANPDAIERLTAVFTGNIVASSTVERLRPARLRKKMQ